MRTIEGFYKVPTGRIAIVASRFNAVVVDGLLKGAFDALTRYGIDLQKVDLIRVPGAFELPLVCDRLAETGKYQGIIALGCLIRGCTSHFDHVAGQCASGLATVGLKHQLPVIFEVLATNTFEDALDRSGGKQGNRGADAVLYLLEMCDLLGKIHE
jgi:6,7-dimethyl-8-ribityllumazine synthase